MFTSKKSPCPDCFPQPVNHLENFISSLTGYSLPTANLHLPRLWRGIENLMLALGLIKLEDDTHYDLDKIFLRTSIVLEAGKKRGLKFWAFKGPRGYNNQFRLEIRGKQFSFDGLPRAEFCDGPLAARIDDKAFVKRKLLEHRLPTPEGATFWFTSAQRAFAYGKSLGYPLVTKPRNGSLTHHVTLDIRTDNNLRAGIKRVFQYEACCIVERFVGSAVLHRVTVIDKKFVACAKRIPAHVTGDGRQTIRQLIAEKDRDPRRGKAGDKNVILYKLVINDVTERLLRDQQLSFEAVPKDGVLVRLQEKALLDLGGDLEEITPSVHPKNRALFEQVAELFGTHFVGLDILTVDMSRAYDEQPFVIIELNSLPFIDMHHSPSIGTPVDVANRVIDLVEKYYY